MSKHKIIKAGLKLGTMNCVAQVVVAEKKEANAVLIFA